MYAFLCFVLYIFIYIVMIHVDDCQLTAMI